ncbi:MAG TPA: hypothetical protein DDE71_06735 [Tenacibaculum sp.]|nr:hypothetical protein [Tenacibaculum sp.]
MDKTELNISELNISDEEKRVLEKTSNIPINLIFETYVVDEAFFCSNIFSDEEKKAFYNCAKALNENIKN